MDQQPSDAASYAKGGHIKADPGHPPTISIFAGDHIISRPTLLRAGINPQDLHAPAGTQQRTDPTCPYCSRPEGWDACPVHRDGVPTPPPATPSR